MKEYKKTIDESRNLRKGAKELGEKLEITSIHKVPIKEIRDPIPYEKVIDYLKTDKHLMLEGTYYPTNVLYKIKKDIKPPKNENMISTWDLREIIYKANNYDHGSEHKITEKEINEMIDRKDIPVEEKMKYFTWLENLEEIKLKKTKTNDVLLDRLEKKEIIRAKCNA